MVSFALAALTAAAGLASASPVKSSPLDQQLGFRLVVNVTDPHHDFKKHPVHGLKLSGLRAAPGADMPTVDKDGYVFYGTKDKTLQWGIDGNAPWGLSSDGTTEALHSLGIDQDEATKGFQVGAPENSKVCVDLRGPGLGGSFAVCDNGFSAPKFAQYEVKYLEASKHTPGKLPKNCVEVSLIPECAPLDLKKATYKHDNAVKTLCHKGKVADIDWHKQPRC